jgi:RimJ/RimL family protein N-acetyltransferase
MNTLMSDTILETQRLILRHWRDSDLEPMAAINQDPQVMEHFPAPRTLEETRNFIAINKPLYDQVGYFIYAVELKDNHELIGFVGLQPVGEEMPFAPAVEILWRIGTKYWGKGYATEAAQAVVDHAFNNLELDELVAFTTTTNTRSEKLMQRLGFTRSEGDDFDHPKIAEGHKLRRHIFYRKHKPESN